MTVIINPGTGPVEGDRANAERNIQAFKRDLKLATPAVKIHRLPTREDDGRFPFDLVRGSRKVRVDMPGMPLDRVRYFKGADPWQFPRLYVDGSSWLWEFAISIARDVLVDHDRKVEKRIRKSELACERSLKKMPRCLACGAVLIMRQRYVRESRSYTDFAIECLVCQPRIEERHESDHGMIFVGPPKLDHWLIRRQEMPPEALLGELCGHYVSLGGNSCRLKIGHSGTCEGYWKVLSKTWVAI